MTSIMYRKKEIFNGEMVEESITPNTNLSSTKIHTNELEPIKAEFEETVQENLSLETQELNIIKKAVEKNNSKRKLAAKELGISERTLYRKIKQYDL